MTKSAQNALRIGIICSLVLAFGFYGFSKAKMFIAGPKIIINYPNNGQSINDSLAIISGQASNVATLFLNGRQILTDKEGNFKESLLLANGYNIIEISGLDKFGRGIKKILELVH